MRYDVRLTALAEEDLAEAYDWLHERGPQAALDLVRGFEAALGRLERFPMRCPSIPENRPLGTGYRQLLLTPYRLIFRVEKDRVLILRLVPGVRLDRPGPPRL